MMYYKFLHERDGKIVSDHGDHVWNIGEWYEIDGDIKACVNGFHASKKPLDALRYVNGNIVAAVEGDGDADVQSNKSCFRKMRVVEAYRWSKTDSVELAVFAAELVIDVFEARCPDDDRPRKAIDAAKAWLETPTAAYAASYAADAARASYDARAAAYAASYAARASYDARVATYAASYAARAASYAADAASYAAADAASCAARAASYAAADAAYADDAAAAAAVAASYARDVEEKINTWMKNRINELERMVDPSLS